MNYKDPKPDIQRIEELVNNVKNGEIRLPNFQRPFVWKKKEVLKLLDSIYNFYPIGSILLWYTSEQLSSERTIADIDLPTDKIIVPTNYVLDGQQRLSTLCGALYWNGNKTDSIWNISFDLDKEEFLHPKDEHRVEFFPLNKLLNTSDFINQCKTFDIHPKSEIFYKRAERLLRSIKDYKIAVVKIGDMTINEVAPIFERINSTGRKLTIVDLMRAATWKGGFDLNNAITSVQKQCEEKNFFNIPDNHILRNISACSGLGINREDIDRLRRKNSEELRIAADKCVQAYSLAIDFLKLNFPLSSYDYLPYGLQLTFLVEFFNVQPYPSSAQKEELKKWFWATAFSRHFGTSNTGQNSRDLANIRKFASSEIYSIPIEHEILLDRFVYDEFKLNIANSKSFVLLIASRNPNNIISGEPIDLFEILSVVNRYDFHHIFPQTLYPEHNLNICLNICLLDRKTNIQISNQRPSNLFADIEYHHRENLEPLLYSNFLNENCLFALKNNDIDSFFLYRREIFRIEIEKLSGRKTSPNTLNAGIEQESTDMESFDE